MILPKLKGKSKPAQAKVKVERHSRGPRLELNRLRVVSTGQEVIEIKDSSASQPPPSESPVEQEISSQASIPSPEASLHSSAQFDSIQKEKPRSAINVVAPSVPSSTELRFDFPGDEASNFALSATNPVTIEHLQSEEQPAQAEEPGADLVNSQYSSTFKVERVGFEYVGKPEEIAHKLGQVGYQCLPHLAIQLGLILNTPTSKTRALLLEGPSGCGKSFMAKSLSKIVGAELMCLSCYKEMPMANLIESPSSFALASAMAGNKDVTPEKLMNLGIIARAFLKSQEKPVILLIDELDKPDTAIDTFFLGPIQDARIWLESRAPIDANPKNLLIMFTKNFNRKIDEALLRRCHPITMTYLDSTLERKILSPHCHPQLVANLVGIADRMRNSGGSYQFERPPAPEELLTAGHYVTKLLEWGMADFAYVGKCVSPIIAKSEHDRAVLDHMLRFHPDFMDPLVPDARNAKVEQIQARLGRLVLFQLVSDPEAEQREHAWTELNAA